jgi:hypothetical protein
MAKKKKGAVKGKDARGYGQASAPPSSEHYPQQQQQTQVPLPAEPPSTSSPLAAAPQQAQMPREEQEKQPRSKTTTVRGPILTSSSGAAAAAVPTPAAPNKVVQVSFKTHDGLLQLLGQLAKQEDSEDDNNNNNDISSTTRRTTAPTTITPGSVHHARFASKLALIVYRLEELKFTMPQIEQVLRALNYAVTSIDVALDWLCLHLLSTELPPLFTEYLVRDKQNQTQNQQVENSLTVVKFKALTTTSADKSTTATSEEGDGDRDHLFSERLLVLQQPNESSSLEPNTKSKEEQDEAKAHKAWLLAQYQYEDNEDEMDCSDQGTDRVNLQKSCKDSRLTKQEPMSQDKSGKRVTPPTPTIATNGPASPQQQPTITPSDPVDALDHLLPSPQELQLLDLERELDEAEVDLKNDANNYMRSKQETKELAIHVKKLKQQVGGLRKRVEKQKEKQRISVLEPEPVPESGDKQGREHEKVYETDGLVSTEKEVDEDQEYGGGLFDRTAAAPGKHDNSATSTSTTTSGMANGVDVSALATTTNTLPLKNVDYSIPKGWTGTTPQKTLNEWYKKRQKGKATKLPKPKYHKLPGGGNNKKQQGYRLVIVTEKGESRDFLQQQNHTTFFQGDVQEYLALQALYSLEPTLPLYQLFPPVFRALWLSWVDQVQQEAHRQKQDYVTEKTEKMDRLLVLVDTSHQAQTVNCTTTTTSQSMKHAQNDTKKNSESELLDSWEDTDGKEPGTSTAKSEVQSSKATSSSSKGAGARRLRDEFVQRQSTPAYEEMKRIRTTLPMYAFRQTVLDTIRNNPVTILCAETGAGKTTQCPQYCLEDALLNGTADRINMICTQPRRVAATSVAERVAEEMCEPRGVGSMVGYQIRMESKKSASTKLLFCTTGELRYVSQCTVIHSIASRGSLFLCFFLPIRRHFTSAARRFYASGRDACIG